MAETYLRVVTLVGKCSIEMSDGKKFSLKRFLTTDEISKLVDELEMAAELIDDYNEEINY